MKESVSPIVSPQSSDQPHQRLSGFDQSGFTFRWSNSCPHTLLSHHPRQIHQKADDLWKEVPEYLRRRHFKECQKKVKTGDKSRSRSETAGLCTCLHAFDRSLSRYYDQLWKEVYLKWDPVGPGYTETPQPGWKRRGKNWFELRRMKLQPMASSGGLAHLAFIKR